jgi:ABC-type phosphate transport system ATPase subunit
VSACWSGDDRQVFDRVIFVYQGRLVEQGDTMQVFEHPAEEETARCVVGRYG